MLPKQGSYEYKISGSCIAQWPSSKLFCNLIMAELYLSACSQDSCHSDIMSSFATDSEHEGIQGVSYLVCGKAICHLMLTF